MKRVQRVGFLLASLGVLGIVLQIRFNMPIPVFVSVLCLLFYPCQSIYTNTPRSLSRDGIYLLFFSVVGFFFTFQSAYPVGYADAIRHSQNAIHLLEVGLLNVSGEPTSSYIGLYSLTGVLAQVVGEPVLITARLIPGTTFTATILIYYRYLAGNFLTEGWEKLAATILFGMNWGIFRFLIEYRTLNIAFPLGLLILGIVLQKYTSDAGSMIIVLTILLFGLFISHFTTIIFFSILLGVIFVLQPQNRWTVRSTGFALILGLPLWFLYTAHMTNGIEGVVGGLFMAVINSLRAIGIAGASTSVPNSGTQGLVGMTYGPNLMITQWIIRIGFVISSGIFFTFVAVRKRMTNHWILVLWIWVLAIPLLWSVFLGFTLNPSRILTFVAIPYGIIYVWGFSAGISNLSDVRWRQIGRVIFVFILITATLTTAVKFPQYMIGDTEPIRGNTGIDESAHLALGESDFETRTWLSKYVDEVDIRYQSLIYPFYSFAGIQINDSSELKLLTNPYWKPKNKETYQRCNVVYVTKRSYLGDCVNILE